MYTLLGCIKTEAELDNSKVEQNRRRNHVQIDRKKEKEASDVQEESSNPEDLEMGG